MAESVKTAPQAEQIERRILSMLERRDTATRLRVEAKALLARGVSREMLVTTLEKCVLRMRADNREKDEDVLLDVMDCLTGWCAPSAKLEA